MSALNKILSGFLNDGVSEFGPVLDQKKCDEIMKNVLSNRDFGPNIFMDEESFRKNPSFKHRNPIKGFNNFAETINLDFIEKNPIVVETLTKLLGPDYNVLLKKFVVSVPLSWVPQWIKDENKEVSLTNLGPYIKQEFSDMSYFIGVDFHQDLIDHKDRVANFITLYVYLDDVTEQMSPLVIVPESHIFGATTFPHNLKLN